jgi:methylated-DNA-[protein]-cysteine S-methyltransferase
MKNKVEIEYFKSPFGELILGSFEGKLCLCDWRYRRMRSSVDKRIKKELKAEFVEEGSGIIEITKTQLKEYFNQERKEFDIPLLMVGTDFQKSVWRALLQIPYGKAETYFGLSKKLDNLQAVRAVASANGANAISIVIPCHRIIGSNGKLVGYAGGLYAKDKLLSLENVLNLGQLRLF